MVDWTLDALDVPNTYMFPKEDIIVYTLYYLYKYTVQKGKIINFAKHIIFE